MHGKPSLRRTLQSRQRAANKAAYKKRSYVDIGSWRLQENSDGDLVIMNNETQKTIIFYKEVV